MSRKHGGGLGYSDGAPALCLLYWRRPHAARLGHILHLLGEHQVTWRRRTQRYPVARRCEQRLPLCDYLVLQNLHSTQQVIPWLKDSLLRIFFGQRFVVLPVEIAAVPGCVHIGKLEQAFLSHSPLANRILDCYFRFGMAYISR